MKVVTRLMAGNVSLNKAALRKDVESLRRALSSEEVNRWGGEVQRHLAALPLLSERVVRAVAVYDAQAFEVPLANFALEMGARGVLCVYPRIARGSRVLSFHPAGEQWAQGPLGLREPPLSMPGPTIADIDVFVVPGVAFTRQGHRLGRGAGYYDATLALRGPQAVVIGVAFECCVVNEIPVESHDVMVDFLATESGVHPVSKEQS